MRCCAQVALAVEVIKKISADTVKVSKRLAADRCDEALRYCCIAIAMTKDNESFEAGGVCIGHCGCVIQNAIDDVDESRGALGQRLLIQAVIIPENF